VIVNDLQKSIETLVSLALAEDLDQRGDVTSLATLPETLVIRGQIVAKAEGVVAGLPAVLETYRQVDELVQVQPHITDGERVTPGTLVCEVFGPGRAVLTGERTALNFLQRMSGVATLTSRFVEAITGTEAVILDTRKTTPGFRHLEKYAVRMGGGQNHRIGLYDQVMIKDNHIDACGSITAAVEAVRAEFARSGEIPIVVEVRDFAELQEALPLNVHRILLDNMSEDEMRQAVQMTVGRTPLEASGNMSLARVRAVAETGVNFISVGALTHSAPALDLSMRLNRVV
jgi:nicotinate-nucleotide pyrophosphorylase (carboxylating)